MAESITCPKCALVSFHPDDIKYRYCGTCGYHDVVATAPLGAPGVSAKFRQPTPVMQLKSVVMLLEGQFHNWDEGIVDNARLKETFKRCFDDINELYPHLENGKWIRSEKGPHNVDD